MTVSHSAQMLLKLEKYIPISHVTLETVPKYANIERPTSSQLYASFQIDTVHCLSHYFNMFDVQIIQADPASIIKLVFIVIFV